MIRNIKSEKSGLGHQQGLGRLGVIDNESHLGLAPRVCGCDERERAGQCKEAEMSWNDEDAVFHVVINHEEQYSIWPEYREIPNGWKSVGKQGSKQDCLDYIDKVWTDMRPLSLRKHMEASRADRSDV
jgi:MbtH protein